jgi:hypothetical protein
MEYETLYEVKDFFTALGMLSCTWGVAIFLLRTFRRRFDLLRYLAYLGAFLIVIALHGGVLLGFLISAIILGPHSYDNITFWLVGCVAAYPITVLPYRYLKPWHS